MMKKIVVLGATGMLGHKTCQILAAEGHQVVGSLRDDAGSVRRRFESVFHDVELLGNLDVLTPGGVEGEIERQAPDFVVNAIGLVKQLDDASDPLLAVAINSLLPHRLANACERAGARLIHISTDCVFDGTKGNYRETDFRDADDLYGRSKALGETRGRQASAVTLRTSFIGRELKADTHGLVEWFLAQEGGRVRGFAGAIYTGLTSLELARVIAHLVEEDPGLAGVHQVASSPISKYDLLKLIRDVYGLDIEIDRVTDPKIDRSLVMSSWTTATGYRSPDWETMIQEMHDDPTPYDELTASVDHQPGRFNK